MSINTKDWTAQINRMPGDPFFRTQGTVTVNHPGIMPKLVLSPLQDKSFDLRLDLVLEKSDGIYSQVVTDRLVEYKVTGESYVTGVSIFYEDKLLHHIDKVLITH